MLGLLSVFLTTKVGVMKGTAANKTQVSILISFCVTQELMPIHDL